MFSYFLGYLETKAVNVLLDEKLRDVNDDPDSRFCTLKQRFREHCELLQKEKGFDREMVQHMIDLLGTTGNYETELTRAVAGNTEVPHSGRSGLWSKCLSKCGEFASSIKSIFETPSKPTFKGYKLNQQDDATFLTEICTIIKEEPAYRQIVEEILQEATSNLGIRLKKLEKELLQIVRKEMAGISRQEIDDRINAERLDADLAAKARLRSLICAALDAEADHPSNP